MDTVTVFQNIVEDEYTYFRILWNTNIRILQDYRIRIFLYGEVLRFGYSYIRDPKTVHAGQLTFGVMQVMLSVHSQLEPPPMNHSEYYKRAYMIAMNGMRLFLPPGLTDAQMEQWQAGYKEGMMHSIQRSVGGIRY